MREWAEAEAKEKAEIARATAQASEKANDEVEDRARATVREM